MENEENEVLDDNLENEAVEEKKKMKKQLNNKKLFQNQNMMN